MQSMYIHDSNVKSEDTECGLDNKQSLSIPVCQNVLYKNEQSLVEFDDKFIVAESISFDVSKGQFIVSLNSNMYKLSSVSIDENDLILVDDEYKVKQLLQSIFDKDQDQSVLVDTEPQQVKSNSDGCEHNCPNNGNICNIDAEVQPVNNIREENDQITNTGENSNLYVNSVHVNNENDTNLDHLYGNNYFFKCCTLNVCGIKSKLHDFNEFISDNGIDIVAVGETKLGELDDISNEFDGYTVLANNRKKCARASGGVALIIKNNIINHFQQLECTNDFSLFCRINSELLGKQVIIGVVYIPPENSIYSNIQLFEVLENQIIDLSKDDIPICILGDFNARSKELSDVISFDENIVDQEEEIVKKQVESESLLEEFGIPLNRKSCDLVANNYGYRLIELCRNLGIMIANGRCGKDNFVGKVTCGVSSLIDYVICSPEMLCLINDFEVVPFCELLSDKHSPILFTFKKLPEPVIEVESANTKVQHSEKIIWNNNEKDNFVKSIDINHVKNIEHLLNECNESLNTIDQKKIEDIVEQLKQVFETSAVQCNMKRKNKCYTRRRKCKSKPWYTKVCEERRKEYFKAKRASDRNPSNDNTGNTKRACKEYKKVLKSEYKKYFKELNIKLKNLKSKDPKQFWKLLKTESKTVDKNMPNIDAFKEHFETLNSGIVISGEKEVHLRDRAHNEVIEEVDKLLNRPFSSAEVSKCIRKLKNGKSYGFDNILNEFIKSTEKCMLSIYVKLFNIVLQTGIVPDDWVKGMIIPLFKKGEHNNVDNYRGITILSCLGKLFTSVINNRLTEFVEQSNIIGPEQAGFRNSFSTMDHIFTFKLLLDLYLSKKKKLYVAFIDYRKAFDSIDRICMWTKILDLGVNGKIFTVVYNLYKKAKSCMKVNGCHSSFFSCMKGVRQGENLSPLLFSLFLSDLNNFLSKKYQGLSMFNNMANDVQDDTFDMYFKLFVLLYADDTIVLAESVDELQVALNAMVEYCNKWKLEINNSKSKVLVFSRGKIRNKPKLWFDGKQLEVVYKYDYLGITLNFNGAFKLAIKKMYDTASRAMFALLKKARSLNLDIDTQLHLFDSTVLPILLYGCEVWGFSNIDMVEKLHLRFCKYLLKVKKSTPNVMVYGELGRQPIRNIIISRMLNFWLKIQLSEKIKLSSLLYKVWFELYSKQGIKYCKWIDFIKINLDSLGLSNIWLTQGTQCNENWF